jgi:ankyrin repeat protein
MLDAAKTLIQNRDDDKLVKLISADPVVLDQVDQNGTSGLLLIAYAGLPKAFEKARLLKTAYTFHEAIVYGRNQEVANALKDPSCANTYSNDGFTPLSLAAFFNQTEIAKLLLTNGADPNLQATNSSKVNALHSAVARQNIELCKLFIQQGGNVNACQTQNVTPLHSAAHLGNLELVKLLVDNGADIGSKTDGGKTAMDFAVEDKHDDVRLYLQEMLSNKY